MFLNNYKEEQPTILIRYSIIDYLKTLRVVYFADFPKEQPSQPGSVVKKRL
jgi:uncharacterized protein YgfB (UPF0149 family)